MIKKKLIFVGGPLHGRAMLVPFCKSVLPGAADYPGPGRITIKKTVYRVGYVSTTENGKTDVVFFFRACGQRSAIRKIFKLAMKGGA